MSNKIKKILWDFVWLGGDKCKKDHLVRWKFCCRSKEDEGLGLGNLVSKTLPDWQNGCGIFIKDLLFFGIGSSRANMAFSETGAMLTLGDEEWGKDIWNNIVDDMGN